MPESLVLLFGDKEVKSVVGLLPGGLSSSPADVGRGGPSSSVSHNGPGFKSL